MAKFFNDGHGDYFLSEFGRRGVALVNGDREVCVLYDGADDAIQGQGYINGVADNEAIKAFCAYYEVGIIWR